MDLTRDIGGNTFKVSPLGYEETCDLQPLLAPALADFVRLYGLFVAEVSKVMSKGEQIAGMEVTAVALTMLPEIAPALEQASGIVASIASKLPAPTLKTLRRSLLRGATMDGKPLYATVEGQGDMIGTLMRGRTIDGWRLLMFALEVNYPDFFALVRPLAASRKAQSATDSTTPTDSAGPAAG